MQPDDYAHLSSLLRRLHDRWWGEMLSKQYNAAAFTANDLEACSRTITNITHKLNEAQLAAPQTLNTRHQDSPLPPTEGDKR